MRDSYRSSTVAGLLVVLLLCFLPGSGLAVPDYQGMAKRIEGYFNKALKLYKAGKIEEAKISAQDAYFKVFENMEGPIRVNISAKKNYLLEEEFSGIRDMIKNKKPYEAVKDRAQSLVSEIYNVAKELEGGFVLKAESAYGDSLEETIAATTPESGKIPEVWKLDLDMIQTEMKSALDALKLKNDARAQESALQAYFGGYRSTLLEKAVTSHRSPQKNQELVEYFMRIIELIRAGETDTTVRPHVQALLTALSQELVELPLVRGAVAKAAPRLVTRDTIPDKDWEKIGSDMMADIEKAIAKYVSGDKKGAFNAVQSIYFDSFEGTKLEISIGVLYQELMLSMEDIFGSIIRGMEAGLPVKKIRGYRDDLNEKLKEALELLAAEKKKK